MSRILNSAVVILLFAAFSSLHSQNKSGTTVDQGCGFKEEVVGPLVNEAERGKFIVRRVEFAGSTYIRDRELREHLVTGMTEGSIFNRGALERSLRRIGKMKELYPLTLENIEVRLDRATGDVDTVICVVEKAKLQ